MGRGKQGARRGTREPGGTPEGGARSRRREPQARNEKEPKTVKEGGGRRRSRETSERGARRSEAAAGGCTPEAGGRSGRGREGAGSRTAKPDERSGRGKRTEAVATSEGEARRRVRGQSRRSGGVERAVRRAGARHRQQSLCRGRKCVRAKRRLAVRRVIREHVLEKRWQRPKRKSRT